MATGGDSKKPSPFKTTLLNLGRTLSGGKTDIFQDALSDLKPQTVRKSSTSSTSTTTDPKQSKSGLTTQTRKGSTTSLKTVETGTQSLKTVKTGNLSSMTDVASGLLKDTGTKPKGQTHPTKFVVEAVNPEEQTTKCHRNLLNAINNLTHAINEA
jgi:hypothetical protein